MTLFSTADITVKRVLWHPCTAKRSYTTERSAREMPTINWLRLACCAWTDYVLRFASAYRLIGLYR